mmetsp:Transcript_122106/g.352973  ORF Transcript_122106/g.352973 Transcript_122106/m.352973 type:complete len:328 (+) Transcript_122106:1583-2566(+)
MQTCITALCTDKRFETPACTARLSHVSACWYACVWLLDRMRPTNASTASPRSTARCSHTSTPRASEGGKHRSKRQWKQLASGVAAADTAATRMPSAWRRVASPASSDNKASITAWTLRPATGTPAVRRSCIHPEASTAWPAARRASMIEWAADATSIPALRSGDTPRRKRSRSISRAPDKSPDWHALTISYTSADLKKLDDSSIDDFSSLGVGWRLAPVRFCPERSPLWAALFRESFPFNEDMCCVRLLMKSKPIKKAPKVPHSRRLRSLDASASSKTNSSTAQRATEASPAIATTCVKAPGVNAIGAECMCVVCDLTSVRWSCMKQ